MEQRETQLKEWEELGLPNPSDLLGSSPLPFITTLLEAIRSGSDETARRFETLKNRVDRLNSEDTSWEERLSLLADLEAEGWQDHPLWPRLRRHWLYRGAEWHFPLHQDELRRLGRLTGVAARAALARHLEAWFGAHPELRDRLLGDLEGVYYLSAWIACRVWAGDPEYGRWLLDHVVDPAVRDVRPSVGFPLLLREEHQADRVGKQEKTILRQEGYAGLLEVIQTEIHKVRGKLGAYWRVTVKNYLRDRLDAEERREMELLGDPIEASPGIGFEEDESRVDLLRAGDPDLTTLATIGEGDASDQLEAVAAMEIADRLQPRLTPRQKLVMSLCVKGLANSEIAKDLKCSEGLVELERRKIREVARQLGLGSPD